MIKKFFAIAAVCFMPLLAAAQSLSIGTVDLEAVQNAMPETSALESEIASRRTNAQNELNKMQNELQTKMTEYQTKQDSLDDVTKQLREEELQTIYQRMQQYDQAVGQQLQQYVQQQQSLIREKVVKAIAAVGDKQKLTCILPVDGISYFSPTDTKDVTAAVKAELGIK